MLPIRKELIIDWRSQRTLRSTVRMEGIGLHSGRPIAIELQPAAPGTGILFRRMDLPNAPAVPALAQCVEIAQRCTRLRCGGAEVHTVEHLLAALRAARLDNVEVAMNGAEPPVAGGSSAEYVTLLNQAGIEEQAERTPIYGLDRPVFLSKGEVHLVALPDTAYRVSYTLHYPEGGAIRSQYCSYCIDWDTFANEIAPCRTFAHYHELEAMLQNGLIKGGSLDSAVVVHGRSIVSKGGLRFPNEMARHKMLDVIGDLALIGAELRMHVIAICAGHGANGEFAKMLLNHITTE